MTTTYDPQHSRYTDEHDVRLEVARVFDVCFECRQCRSLCPTFPSLFSVIESKNDHDAQRLTPDQQDVVLEQCYRCTMCSSMCPYTPGRHELAVDFPRLIDRHHAMQKKNGQLSLTARMGHVITRSPLLVLRVVSRLRPNGLGRHLLARIARISPVHIHARRAPIRLSGWYGKRTSLATHAKSRVAMFPTCVVEYSHPQIGQAVVDVYEHNGIVCSLVGSDRCCGAMSLHQGDVETFIATATRNVQLLVEVVRDGVAIVVPNPRCCSVITSDYPHYVATADAELVAANTFEASEYLVRRSAEDASFLSTDFSVVSPRVIAHHVPMEMQARGVGESGRTLMSLTGAVVTDISLSSGSEALWGAHKDNEDVARGLSEQLVAGVSHVGPEIVATDCPWIYSGLGQQVSADVLHPIELLARAYGLGQKPLK